MVRISALLLSLIVCLLVLCGPAWSADTWTVAGLTDARTSMVETRVGAKIDDTWSAGLLATWFAEAVEPREDWGVGGWLRMRVDPAAVIPVASWLPKVGDWLKLPETLTAETYLIAKLEALPYDTGVDLQGSVGAGAQAGPAMLEFVYGVVEGGEADNPRIASGATLWVGLGIEF